MNIRKVLEEADELRPNVIDDGSKLAWLNDLENTIYHQLILPRMGHEEYEEPHIDSGTDYDHELIVKQPYERLYVDYIMSKIDWVNREWENYNNTAAQFKTTFDEYAAWYGRNHMYITTSRPKNYL